MRQLFAAIAIATALTVTACVPYLQRGVGMHPSYAQADAPAPSVASQGERAPECRMGSDGRQACGYNCRMGSDGVMACANTPDGVCAMGSDGHVSCSRVAKRSHDSGRAPECRMGSHGQNVCGYNCRMGSNGRFFYCASRPDGRCAMNSDGTFTCP
jgi:hypothetical protein